MAVDGKEMNVMFLAGIDLGERLLVVARTKPPSTTVDGDVRAELTFEAAAAYLPTGSVKPGLKGSWREYQRVSDEKVKEMYEREYKEPYGKWWGGGEPK